MAVSRKRRRLLIAAATLAIIGATWWWLSRPQIDPRLVGTWEMSSGGPGWSVFWRLKSDGTAETWAEAVDSRQKLHWWAKGNLIVFVEPGYARHFPEPVLQWYAQITRKVMPGEEFSEYELLEADGRSARMKWVSNVGDSEFVDPEPQTWHRVDD
jgi:hypothetical protein